LRRFLPEVAHAWLTCIQYGNEPSIEIEYSRAVSLIRVPPFSERAAGKEPPKSIWEGVKRDPDSYDEDEEPSYDEDDSEDEYDSYSDEYGGGDEDEDMSDDDDDDDDDVDGDEDRFGGLRHFVVDDDDDDVAAVPAK
jgi:hypothetical protein